MKTKKQSSRAAHQQNIEIDKILENPKRLEILNLLREQEMSVDELATKLGLAKTNLVQHLALLRYTQLVTVRREGTAAFYTTVAAYRGALSGSVSVA
ncbi:winged helix-turn-helix transcriptional regulator [Candidatus Falkowbacteria bacterium]|nr:winged helix-turn-helix transcriptional regulator [Candidatus Falkowbacteria bacterium]